MQVRAVFMVPTYDNDGRQFSAEVMDHVRSLIIEKFGGYTAEIVQGAWADAKGHVYYDENIRYTITMDQEKVADLKEMLAYFKGLLRQEAMYLEMQPVEMALV